ncbi:O-antigen ligase-like membrane protein [Klebsiella oxytoca]|uniref:O-antigen ligase-like membrane protein n=1 Tax=Klebsiella oxytoca TaxID=571 RepID=A0A318FKU2_KLEOX|nr:O-antigen ligase family protein [Klebsiella oxytoca]PXW42881.1 O-antigen ligase-like membrane protein [Klebsiella oxytoca]HCB1497650.1 O-antigen ligase family protein [Klebsiella michiganensis]HCB1844861.1 O-antigen ligase family protein [Klebsiella oxytoca]
MTNKSILAIHFLGVALIGSFIPFKIYPLIYIISATVIFFMGITKKNLSVFLFALFYGCYCVLNFLVNGIGSEEAELAISKLIFNCSFFLVISISAIFSKHSINNDFHALKIIERYLAVVVILSFVQILILQIMSGGVRFSSDNSYTAGLMFTDHQIFWGVADKNIMGAKISLFGFLHSYVYYRLKGKVSYLFGFIYIVCSALTLSRTSLLLSALTFLLLVFFTIKPIYRYYLILPLIFIIGIAAFPMIASLVRLDSITNVSRDDGMGIRVLYWSAFFSRLPDISIWGEGLLSAGDFLGQYSVTGSANNMHNLYINNYLDLGIPGSVFYLGFLVSIFKKICSRNKNTIHSLLILAPIVVVTNTLYTGYDNDTWIYYSLALVISGLPVFDKNKEHLYNFSTNMVNVK